MWFHVKRGKVIGIFVSVLVLGMTGLYFVDREPAEPTYQGKKLSEWLEIEKASLLHNRSPERDRAEFAIRQIGTAGLPYLVKWIQYERPRWQTMMFSVLRKGPFGIGKRYAWQAQNETRGSRRAEAAISGFGALDELASPAVAELCELADDTRCPVEVSSRAVQALAYVGKAGFPCLFSILTNVNQRSNCRFLAAASIGAYGKLGSNGAVAVPELLKLLQSRDRQLASAAAVGLGNLSLEPDVVVPALTNCLQRTEHSVVMMSTSALSRFGSNAAAAVPGLLVKLNDTNAMVRRAASNALMRIDPTVFK